MAEQIQNVNVFFDYAKFKAETNAQMSKVASTYILVIPQFSVNNGQPIDPQVVTVSRKAVNDSIVELQAKIDSCHLVLSDMNALDTPPA